MKLLIFKVFQKKTYYSPVVRQIHNMDIAENFIKRERKEFFNDIREINNWLFIEIDFLLDKYYSRIRSEENKKAYLYRKINYLQSDEVKKEIQMVKKEWNKIRDNLQKNARFELAPKYYNL